jgi:myo-inositol 2-dehydrogenase / D-chiro-inositol 1-dehydrogenase
MKNVRIGIIGTGWFSEKHAAMLSSMDGVQVSGVCGSSLEKAERMAVKYDAAAYEDVEHILDEDKPDAVYICVPPFAHGRIELALAERGIPFFVEKPLGVDLDTPSTILEAVSARKLITSVGYHFRYMDSTAKARELLQGRTAGMALGYWTGGMPGVSWWRKAEGSGGQFVEQTTHIVDLLRFTLGEVEEVYAVFAQRHKHLTEEGVTVPDVGTVSLRMTSGAVANISNTCMLPVGHTTGLHIYTDAGVLEISGQGLKESVPGRVTEYQNRTNPYELENQAFIQAVRTGDTSGILSSYGDAWRSQQIAVAANESAKTGKPVKL